MQHFMMFSELCKNLKEIFKRENFMLNPIRFVRDPNSILKKKRTNFEQTGN